MGGDMLDLGRISTLLGAIGSVSMVSARRTLRPDRHAWRVRPSFAVPTGIGHAMIPRALESFPEKARRT